MIILVSIVARFCRTTLKFSLTILSQPLIILCHYDNLKQGLVGQRKVRIAIGTLDRIVESEVKMGQKRT